MIQAFPTPHICEEIEEYAKQYGVSVFYMYWDELPIAILVETDLCYGDTITIQVPVGNKLVWETRIFKSMNPAETVGQPFIVYRLY